MLVAGKIMDVSRIIPVILEVAGALPALTVANHIDRLCPWGSACLSLYRNSNYLGYMSDGDVVPNIYHTPQKLPYLSLALRRNTVTVLR